ncbi:Maf family protein [Castellaniella sp.]|uniref:Maf family protein n=1 Tax=Castellaniella sp. TaxID=1955812 RepID=UPI002B0019A2|nr:Maf family protein [Castellaniella sp.]
MPPGFILLASASPRRHEILDLLGITHGILRVPAPEGPDEPQLVGETAEDYVRRTARDKAVQAMQWLAAGGAPPDIPSNWPVDWRQAPILCADTTVILDGDVLGKPVDLDDAGAMLRRLSGRTHQVHTAVVLAVHGQLHETCQVSQVSFQILNAQEITQYCATHEPLGKAGSYAIQGRAAAFITHLSGSHSGVMGLPAHETLQLLKAWQATA